MIVHQDVQVIQVLTDCHCYHSFVDRDMLMRHFGHSVGHLQYERQQAEPNLEMAEVESSDDDMAYIEEDKQCGTSDMDTGAELEDGAGDSDVDDDDRGSEADDCYSVSDRDSDDGDSVEGGYGSF